MINPKLLKANNKKWRDPSFAGGKIYIPVLVGAGQIYRTRKVFQRESEAQAYAEKLLKTWLRVYPIFQRFSQVEPTPEPAETAA